MKTRIICTLGPASESPEMLKKLIGVGLGVARINCTHASIEDIQNRTRDVKAIRSELGTDTIVMLDTKGPDVRIGKFENGTIELAEGDLFTFDTDPAKTDVLGNEKWVYVNWTTMPQKVQIGQELRLCDGMVFLNVEKIEGTKVMGRVFIGGTVKNKKSLAAPGCDLGLKFISDLDEADIKAGCAAGIDWVAASFVSCKQDVLDMRELLKKHGGEHVKIVSKIESRFGVNNMDEIIEATDGVMVARGDMGIELDVEELPVVQKILIAKTKAAGKFIATATEMFESMIEKPRPTRAEVSDVANAVWDGTDLVMLSAETTVGKYPVRCVDYMRRAAEYAEKHPEYNRI